MYRKLLYSLMERKYRDVKKTELADAIGIHKAELSHFFGYRNELTFTTWILAIRYLKPEKEREIVAQLADAMIENEERKNCRQLMEYASTQRDFKLLEKLVTTQMNAPKENKTWAQYYSVALKFQQRAESPENLLLEIDKLKPYTNELAAFSSILKALVYYTMQEYKCMFRLAKFAEKQSSMIKDSFIRDCYLARVSEIFARGYLYLKNDVRKARFYANSVLNSKFLHSSYKVHIYHLLGTSYLFEDYDQCIQYFNIYRDLLKGGDSEDLAKEIEEKDIYFAKVLWDRCDETANTSDPIEKMHYLARKGCVKDVENLSKEVSCDDAFVLCYLGMAYKDPELLLLSMARFIETGDKFFAELPKREIEEHPAYIVPAEVICNIKIA